MSQASLHSLKTPSENTGKIKPINVDINGERTKFVPMTSLEQKEWEESKIEIILQADLVQDEDNVGKLKWQVDESVSLPNVFVSITPPDQKSRIKQNVYYYSQCNLKMQLLDSMFPTQSHFIRVKYGTSFLDNKIMRIDAGSHVKGKGRVAINNKLMCHPPEFVSVDLPIRHD